MLRMYAAAMAAALVAPAFAIPAAAGLSYGHTLALSSPLSSDGYAAVETQLSALMSQSNGVATTVSIVTPEGNRRLQGGSSLTITYVVACGASCDAVADVCPSLRLLRPRMVCSEHPFGFRAEAVGCVHQPDFREQHYRRHQLCRCKLRLQQRRAQHPR